MKGYHFAIGIFIILASYHFTKYYFGVTGQYIFVGAVFLIYIGFAVGNYLLKKKIKQTLGDAPDREKLTKEYGFDEEYLDEVYESDKDKRKRRKKLLHALLIGIPLWILPNLVYFLLWDVNYSLEYKITLVDMILFFSGFGLFLIAIKLVFGDLKVFG